MASRLTTAGRSGRAFLDTNILVYSDDPRDSSKHLRAVNLIRDHLKMQTGVVSLQVLQEYFVIATAKLKLDRALARQRVEIFARLNVAEPTVNDVLAAIDFHRLHRLSFWDSLILRMTKQAGCRVLLTEDLQHGQLIDGIRIVNPFI